MPLPCDLPPRADVVLFVLDDARFDQEAGFAATLARLAPHAVTFSRAYVTTPLCCPERASFLAGGYYAHEVGVLGNQRPNGGATRFDDTRTMAVRLQEAGYATSLLGKYLNDYELLGEYVPPGWSDWGVNVESGGWTNFSYLTGSSGPTAATKATTDRYPGYITDWQEERAVSFLAAHPDEPRVLYLSFRAPHHPHTPAPEDADAFPDYLYRDRAYQEADVSDKPPWVQALPLFTAEELATADTNNRERLQSLLAVDRAMVAVIDAVEAAGDLDRTVFVLTSDNGTMFGEHRLVDKGVGYEEAVRVPLVVAHSSLAPRTTDALVAMNLDVAATVQQLAGLAVEGDGQSLLPHLCADEAGRDHVLVQAWPGDTPAWSGIVTDRYSYLESDDGGVELYDLTTDPYQEASQHTDAGQAERIAAFAATLAAERGLTITTSELPGATVDAAYSATFERWGGVEPVVWSLRNGQLPRGLTLSEAGVLDGRPTQVGTFDVEIEATDSSVSAYDGQPQHLSRGFTLEVGEAADTGEGPKGRDCGCASGGARSGWGAAAGLLLVGWATGRRAWRRGARSGWCRQAGETDANSVVIADGSVKTDPWE